MTTCKAGDVVIVPFPFIDLQTTKRRPALVLARVTAATLPALVIVAMITSQLRSDRLVGDYRISQWREAGLIHPSKARLAKVVSLEQRMVMKRLGSLRDRDVAGVRRELRKVLSAWK